MNLWADSVGITYLANEETLENLRDWIRDQPGDPTGKFLDQIDDPGSDSTTFQWAGSLNDPFLVAALNEAKSVGVTATVQSWPYSLSEINAAEDAIIAAHAQLQAAGFNLQLVGGIGDTVGPIKATGVLTPGTSLDSIQSLINSLTNIPVTAVSGGAVEATRQADTSPFWAGAYIDDLGNQFCSTGFSMYYQGKAHTITARHCIPQRDQAGYGFYAYSGNGRPGETVMVANTGAVRVLAGDGGPYAYDGTWDNTAAYAKAVADERTAGKGDNVCSGGGNSGEHCGATINDTDLNFVEPTDYQSVSVVSAKVQNGIAAAQGDSGGPVIQAIGSGAEAGEVHAVGIIQGIEQPFVNCPTVASGPGPYCSQTVLFSYVSTVINHNALTLDTY